MLLEARGQNNQDYVNPRPISAQNKSRLTFGVGLASICVFGKKSYTKNIELLTTYRAFKIGRGSIDISGLFSYRATMTDFDDAPYTFSEQGKYCIIGLRSAYDWLLPSSTKCDFYIGAMAFYKYAEHQYLTNYPYYNIPGYEHSVIIHNSTVASAVFAGLRYYLTKGLGIWMELAYNYSLFSFGASYTL
jgi:hypothetical protein